MTLIDATYVLPVRTQVSTSPELTVYLQWLCERLEVIVVDGSPDHVFAAHECAWPSAVIHCPPDGDALNGKVAGVLTGLRLASHERVIIADDDVRYDDISLERVVELLDDFTVVRPQNYYAELPWHARLDSARSLLNRCTGGDWPGTLGVRRSLLLNAGGYDGDVLFENLELVRTVRAADGSEIVPLDLYVRRLPPGTSHFFSQRVRQAYDELARPARLLTQLALLPFMLAVVRGRRMDLVLGGGIAAVGIAEIGRRRAGGRDVFPPSLPLLAPVWLLERAICIWLALGCRLLLGGVPYRGLVLARAAHSTRDLRRRLGESAAKGMTHHA